jgi:methyl-accepting chemotaxis protein
MARLSDIPIIWRVVLAPLLLLAMTSGVIWWIDANAERSLTALAEGSEQSLQSVAAIYTSSAVRLQRVDELVATVYQVQSDAMRHMSLSGTGLDNSKLAEIRAQIAKSLARASQLVAEDAVAGQPRGTDDPAKSASISDAGKVLAAYEKAVIDLGDMADIDRLDAVGWLGNVEVTFREVERTLLAMQETQRSAAQTDAEKIRQQSSETMIGVRSHAASTRANSWAVAASALAVGLMVSVLIGRGISRPLASITRAMTRLAGGELAIEIPAVERRDEVGEIAKATLVFKQHMIKAKQLAAEQADERHVAEAAKHAALVRMADKIEAETTTALRDIGIRTTTMTTTADEMSASAARTGKSAESAAAASAQALVNVQTVATAAEQLSVSIRQIGARVGQSTDAVGRAVAAGTESRTTIEALNEQVAHIGAVADMIGEIAAKTNLLALNATIEAARAGDAGKGFAVVASEVKALATQTARSTQEITEHIGQVRRATGASVAAVARIEQTIGEINAITGSIAVAVEEQGVATAQIARNVTETASAANEMTGRITEVSTEAKQTGKHATVVGDNAAALNTAMVELRLSIISAVRNSTIDVDHARPSATA